MPGSLEAPLARALHKWAEDDWEWGLDYHTEEANRCEENTPRILASLRSDPDTLETVARWMHEHRPHHYRGGADDGLAKAACIQFGWEKSGCVREAKVLVDAIFGPRESAGGMEP